MRAMLVDINHCNGCRCCQIACKDEHVGNDWSPIAKPQPDIGQFWMKVTDVVQGSVPKVRVRYLPEICQHCEDAPCIKACGTGAIYRRDDGIVIIDPGKCNGGRRCVAACPYGAIYFNDELNIAQKCTFCAHLLDDGWNEPRCVDACPTDALRFGEESELEKYVDGAELLKPEQNTRPRVYYKGLPNKVFIAGAVFDPAADECLEDCTVVLTACDRAISRLRTDDFGDFWFERLKPGTYSLVFEKDGYRAQRIDGIDASADINIGDIELHRNTEEVA